MERFIKEKSHKKSDGQQSCLPLAGSKHIGISATTTDKELYAAEIALRTDVADLLTTRRELRRGRRYRKARYRKARFNNRKRNDGWLAPSIRQNI